MNTWYMNVFSPFEKYTLYVRIVDVIPDNYILKNAY